VNATAKASSPITMNANDTALLTATPFRATSQTGVYRALRDICPGYAWKTPRHREVKR
jgi:hypothetical protein